MDRDRERRWIILGEDGRFVTLVRATDPTGEEIAQVEAAIRARGLAGWLAVVEGNRYTTAHPMLMEVQPIADPARTFAEAAAGLGDPWRQPDRQ